MKPKTVTAILLAVLFSTAASAEDPFKRIAPPPQGKLYHAVMAEDPTLSDEQTSLEALEEYEAAAGKRVAIVYFTHNWFEGREFPLETARWIAERGCVSYVRLMLRSDYRQNRADKRYSLSKIIAGRFDGDLRSWASSARDFGQPMLVEYGTECNGKWFPWNGWWNGRGKTGGFGDPAKADGPERFVAAFRHIVDVMRAEGADNISWVWHPDASDVPDVDWNRFDNYYPGDGYVDWIAVSAYGPQVPTWEWGETFREMVDPWYQRAVALAPGKPLYVAEFGSTHTSEASENDPAFRADNWARAALDDILGGRWPALIGFSWWNEAWQNDNKPEHDTNMRIQDWKPLQKVFRKALRENRKKLQLKPLLR